jgi:hypothetical protein
MCNFNFIPIILLLLNKSRPLHEVKLFTVSTPVEKAASNKEADIEAFNIIYSTSVWYTIFTCSVEGICMK